MWFSMSKCSFPPSVKVVALFQVYRHATGRFGDIPTWQHSDGSEDQKSCGFASNALESYAHLFLSTYCTIVSGFHVLCFVGVVTRYFVGEMEEIFMQHILPFTVANLLEDAYGWKEVLEIVSSKMLIVEEVETLRDTHTL